MHAERGVSMELTKSELEIMNVIWGAGRPLTRGEILDLSVDKNWKDNSIHILLNRLLAKGALAESGFARGGKSYGRLYEAKLSGAEYYAQNVFTGGPERLEMLLRAMLTSPEITPELLDRFGAMIEEKKKELKK